MNLIGWLAMMGGFLAFDPMIDSKWLLFVVVLGLFGLVDYLIGFVTISAAFDTRNGGNSALGALLMLFYAAAYGVLGVAIVVPRVDGTWHWPAVVGAGLLGVVLGPVKVGLEARKALRDAG
ncbi:hypothetical protein GCM10027589_17060 [Actinocorallia lasiicapitis]